MAVGTDFVVCKTTLAVIPPFAGGRASTEEPTSLSPLSSPALKPKKIRARPLGQQAVKEDDLKPEFRMKVRAYVFEHFTSKIHLSRWL